MDEGWGRRLTFGPGGTAQLPPNPAEGRLWMDPVAGFRVEHLDNKNKHIRIFLLTWIENFNIQGKQAGVVQCQAQ